MEIRCPPNNVLTQTVWNINNEQRVGQQFATIVATLCAYEVSKN